LPERMHGNRRYVKLTWIGLLGLLSLACAGVANAEVVTTRADRGVLAVASDGTPYVAYAVGRNLYLANRRHSGAWRSIRLGRLPGPNVTLAGIRVSDRPHRVVSVLAEDTGGRWITLARGSRIAAVARAAAGSRFGPAGLTLDAQQRPAIAYAVQRPSGDTFLRLVTYDRLGRPHVRGITQGGFPASSTSPGAAPVLVRGRLHVVETYASAVIDWGPKTGGGWEGQYLYASRAGFPTGPVGAVFIASTLFAAWAQVYPGEPEDISVQLSSSAQTQETWTLTHGSYVTLVDGGGYPETGAVDWVDLGDWREYAAVVVLGTNAGEWQLDGRLEGYGVARRGLRQVLLSRDRGLEWFQAPGPAAYGIQIWMGGVDATGKVTGSVVGQTAGGVVEIYREVPHAPRELVASALVAADSSFAAQLPPPSPGTVYRAVYVDPRTGFPFGALAGISAGVSG
jgi:hypothetical protein